LRGQRKQNSDKQAETVLVIAANGSLSLSILASRRESDYSPSGAPQERAHATFDLEKSFERGFPEGAGWASSSDINLRVTINLNPDNILALNLKIWILRWPDSDVFVAGERPGFQIVETHDANTKRLSLQGGIVNGDIVNNLSEPDALVKLDESCKTG
jgi:hypothetical protein